MLLIQLLNRTAAEVHSVTGCFLLLLAALVCTAALWRHWNSRAAAAVAVVKASLL